MNKKYQGAIVVQGPSQYVRNIKDAWKGYNIIWSTWKGEESHYNADDIVVYNEMPTERGKGNVALQQRTTLNGILKAKELGFERVLKWRSDMIPTNADKFVELFFPKSINMFFFHVANGGYYVDYFMEGDADDIFDMWSFDDMNPPFAERALTNNIRSRGLKNFVFIGTGINQENDVHWLKKKIKLSDPAYQKSGSGFITDEIYYD